MQILFSINYSYIHSVFIGLCTRHSNKDSNMFEEAIEKDGRAFRRFEPVFDKEVEKVINKV